MKKADFDREVARRRGKRDVTAASANGQYPDEPDDPDDPDDPLDAATRATPPAITIARATAQGHAVDGRRPPLRLPSLRHAARVGGGAGVTRRAGE